MVEEYDIHLSKDDYLLQKVVPSSKILRIIDWKKFRITKEYLWEQSKLKLHHMDENYKFVDERKQPDHNNEDEMDKFYITDMCLPYNPAPDDRDLFVWYNNIGALCGDAGYLRIRDGYVWGRKSIWRS